MTGVYTQCSGRGHVMYTPRVHQMHIAMYIVYIECPADFSVLSRRALGEAIGYSNEE